MYERRSGLPDGDFFAWAVMASLRHSALRRRFVCSADGTRSTARVTLGAAGLHDLAKISELRASLGESALELLRRERAATMQNGEVGP